MATNNKIFDAYGRNIAVNKQPSKSAFGQFGSIYEFPNQDRFRPRTYVNQDTELGAGAYTRDLLVRWSREMTSQMPFIQAAIRTLALFAVGGGAFYLPTYSGENEAWWTEAQEYLVNDFYKNCTKRGQDLDFQTLMFVASQKIDEDGDFLCIYGKNEAKVQIVPCHRIKANQNPNTQDTIFPTAFGDHGVQAGPLPNTIVADGVIYDHDGLALGYNVLNPNNMVNSLLGNSDDMVVSARNAHLIYDRRFFDKGRGYPSISSGILQAMSLQELDSYQTQKLIIKSLLAYVEKTPEGEGPLEESMAISRMLGQSGKSGGITTDGTANAGIRVVNNPFIRYLSANGTITALDNDGPSNEYQDHRECLQNEILQTIGVPHALLFSHDAVGGRISDAIAKTFNGAIQYRQKILDKWGKFMCSWAIAKAIQNGDLPPNDEENLTEVIGFTHPPAFGLNDSYDRKDDLAYNAAGLKSLDEIAQKRGKTGAQIIREIEKDNIQFFQMAKRVADETKVDLSLVLANLKDSLKAKVTIDAPSTEDDAPAPAPKATK